jgi:hypothetical protein
MESGTTGGAPRAALDRLAGVGTGHAGCAPQAARAGHIWTVGRDRRAIVRHQVVFLVGRASIAPRRGVRLEGRMK